MKYQVRLTYWVEVDADSEDEAIDLADMDLTHGNEAVLDFDAEAFPQEKTT